MASVVFDASTLVGAFLKAGAVPERALLLARTHETICLSPAVEAEIRDVFSRPKFRKYLAGSRAQPLLDLLIAAAITLSPTETIEDCRDSKDNKYLELALAASAATIVSSDADLLVLDPWRGIRIMSPADYVAKFEGITSNK